MGRFLAVALLVATVALSGCSSKFKSYDGPEVTRVLVYKKQRALFLMHGNQALKAYKFRMGFAPLGHKQFEGDGRTPEECSLERGGAGRARSSAPGHGLR